MIKFQYLLSTLLMTLTFLSCVSQKKHVAEVAARKDCLEREKALQQQNTVLEEQLEAYRNQIAYKDGQIESLNKEVGRLDDRNQQLQMQLNRIINDATSQQERLEVALRMKAEDLAEKERLIDNLQSRLAARDQAMADILGRIESALGQYTADELSIEMRDGKVYVALSDRLLFPSGSYQLDERGKQALGRLADATRRNPEVSIMVEGHTDSIPIKTACIRDNWDLSVLRATSVVRILTGQYEMMPQQFTAAGRSEFEPKASNETREGRSLNRRTEIIIEPHLEEIFDLLREDRLGN
ncbi:MAG: OmpA family protein [Saprospiraceae bacterium]|nr:OmpA family protein [Saprospiraceae bacterium]